MRIFLDTNVLASSIATRGLCNEILESVLSEHELLTCERVLVELERVLLNKMRLSRSVSADFLDLLREESTLIEDSIEPSIPISDPDDLPILACAIAGKAEAFVTGDKALLALTEVDRVPIMSPRQVWTRLAGL